MTRRHKKAFLDNEKKIILAFRFVVALVAFAFLFGQPRGVHVPWQFYFVMGVFLLSNVVFFFEGAETFNTQRAQKYIFVFDVGMLTVLMVFLGFTNKEFYLVFLLTIFVSAISKKTSHAFAISAVMAGLYVVFTLHGKTDVELTSTSFLVRVILFFVVSSFVGHISEVAEASRLDVRHLVSLHNEWKERVVGFAVEQEKMAAVGLLAAGVAHEFNNLLAGIQGYADLTRMDPAQAGEFADAISEQCKRAAGLVRDLLSFSRKRGGDAGPVDVGEVVDQVLRLVRKELAARSVEVERRVADAPPVKAEPGAIERTVLNIVTNAIGAMDKGGNLTVGLSARNGSVTLRVADDGPGMSPEVLSRVFEPFFGTRPAEGEGVVRATGLGLAVSKQLVERCGGTIGIESAPGQGTAVTVNLPAAPEAAGCRRSNGTARSTDFESGPEIGGASVRGAASKRRQNDGCQERDD